MSHPRENPPTAIELWQLSEHELRDRLVAIETLMNQLYGESLQIIAECQTRGEKPFGYTRLKCFLHDLLNLSTRDAQNRIEHAEALMNAPTVTGAELAAPLAETGQALLDGVVSAKHVAQIHKTMRELPDATSAEDRGQAERILGDKARELDPVQLARTGQRILEHLDPDGDPPDEREWVPPVNELRVQRKRNGRLALNGELDPVTGRC